MTAPTIRGSAPFAPCLPVKSTIGVAVSASSSSLAKVSPKRRSSTNRRSATRFGSAADIRAKIIEIATGSHDEPDKSGKPDKPDETDETDETGEADKTGET